MNPAATPWPRPHYAPGGGDAFVGFLVFGDLHEPLRVSRSRHRSNGLPAGVDAVRHDRQNEPAAVEPLLAGPVGKMLHADDPALHDAVLSVPACVRVQGKVPDPPTLDYLRDVVGVVMALAEQPGAVAVLDLPALRWWRPADWRRDIFDPAATVPTHHVTIFVSDEDDGPHATRWFHTRGLRKFGRPDLSVRHVPASAADAVVDLCNRFIQHMAFGGIVPEGQEVRMRSLPQGMRCRHAGTLDDPDFNNVHLRIDYPHA